MPRLRLYYDAACPNCGGLIDEDRLLKGLPCWGCLPLDDSAESYLAGLEWRDRVFAIARLLEEAGRLSGWEWVYREEDELNVFERFFERATGSRPWSAQRQWARRLLRGESFAITAPTGIGKTTLLAVYALYQALQGRRVYYLLPTSSLAQQVASKLSILATNSAARVEILEYHTLMPRKSRDEALEGIRAGRYDILVTTTAFLSRKWGLLSGTRFDTVIVDDVDAILRNSVNVDRILVLLGASEDDVKAATRLVRLSLRVRANPALFERYRGELEELRRRIEGIKPRLGQLVVASATGRARGFKHLVLSRMLDFSVGNAVGYARNISEYKLVTSDPMREAARVAARLGEGGLVFVAKPLGVQAARRVARLLEEEGVRAGVAVSGRRVVEAFEKGEYDVLVGVASYYGVMVRGLDMPYRVAYAVFIEPPYTRVELQKALNSPRRILSVAKSLGLDYHEYARMLAKLTPDEVELLRLALRGLVKPGGRLAEVLEEALRLRQAILERISGLEGEVRSGWGVLEAGCGEAWFSAPDVYTYIQASGRTSRLLKGYMTKGVVVVISSKQLLLQLLEERLSRIIAGFSFREYRDDVVEEELEEAWETRRVPGHPASLRVEIETSLVVVESPTKARMIAGFWGKPARRRVNGVNVYETIVYNPLSGKTHILMVTSVKGHVYDLTEEDVGEHGVIIEGDEIRPVYAPIVKCNECGAQHAMVTDRCPDCGSTNIEDKRGIVEALRRLAPLVDVVYLATDPDYEGEKIAWDLYALLKPFSKSVKRIEFHEVTRRAFLEALANPRGVDRRLVEAQVVRRVEDRWIGFSLSQHLWHVFNAKWLGAGRVQTPALGFLVERLEEWKRGRCYALILAMPWGRVKLCFRDRSEAEQALREAVEHGVVVELTGKRVETLTPPPPYTTEALLYDASRLLGYTTEKTMKLAQELFENGLITYHRTDSIHVSEVGLGIAKSYMEKHGLSSLYMPRRWGSQGTHEAIRPTMPLDVNELKDAIAEGEVRVVTRLRESHYRLYRLIFERFMASQAKPARVELCTIRVGVGSASVLEVLACRVLEEGFLRFYPYIVRLFRGSLGRVKPLNARMVKTSTVTLYTHGELVSAMKKAGIGRPSTYAKIIEALKRHGYVVESKYRKYLVPTRLGVRVYNYLVSVFTPLVSLETTRRLEDAMEKVAEGKANAAELLLELRSMVHELLERVEARSGERAALAHGDA